MKKNKIFTDEMKMFIFNNYKGCLNKDLTASLNKEFGTNISVGSVKNFKHKYKLSSGITGHFKKGHKPIPRKHSLPKNYKPHNILPIGSESKTSEGYLRIKTEKNKWELKHKYIWEKKNGKIPEGYVIVYLDGDKNNCTLDNLSIIKRKELLIMNQKNLKFNNKELTKTGINIARLQANIYSREK